MLRIVEINDYKGLQGIKDAWKDLFLRSEANNIFLTYEWIDAYVRHFYKRSRLLILEAFDENRLIGIAPLMLSRRRYMGLPVSSLCFIGTDVSDRMDFIVDGDRRKVITLMLDYIMDMKGKWSLLDLCEIVENSCSAEIIKGYAKRNHILSIMGPSGKSFFIEFNGDKHLLHQKFSKKLHRKFRKLNNKDVRLNLKIERYKDGGFKKERLFSDLRLIESNSWKAEKKRGIFLKEDSMNFHREILDIFSKNKWIDISVLKLSEMPIAFVYNYLYNNKLYNYSIAFDMEYSRLSAGTMLVLWVLKDSIDKGIREFDFMRGEGAWKGRLTQDFRTHNRVRIFRNTFYARSLYYFQAAVMPYVRRSKIVYSLWLTIREILRCR